MKSKIEIILVMLTSSFLVGQEYKIQFSHIPIGQGITTKDSIKIVNSIGGTVSKDISSDSFAVGSGLAGVAGVAVSLLGSVGPNVGQNYIVPCFMVVVLGGVGNLLGTVLALSLIHI